MTFSLLLLAVRVADFFGLGLSLVAAALLALLTLVAALLALVFVAAFVVTALVTTLVVLLVVFLVTIAAAKLAARAELDVEGDLVRAAMSSEVIIRLVVDGVAMLDAGGAVDSRAVTVGLGGVNLDTTVLEGVAVDVGPIEVDLVVTLEGVLELGDLTASLVIRELDGDTTAVSVLAEVLAVGAAVRDVLGLHITGVGNGPEVDGLATAVLDVDRAHVTVFLGLALGLATFFGVSSRLSFKGIAVWLTTFVLLLALLVLGPDDSGGEGSKSCCNQGRFEMHFGVGRIG